ncbi:MAG: hypothetical protein IJN90_03890 [Bacilli bacterium]|nr:hypothetical protein [Bacilli bacterium]
MNNSSIHISKFGYFYSYCLNNEHDKKIKREISKLKEIVYLTNNLGAVNNNVYNKKVSRKEERVESILKRIAKKNPDFLISFLEEYNYENEISKKESDPLIIARHIAQSFYDTYQIKKKRKSNIVSRKNNYQAKENDIVINLTDEEKEKLDSKSHTNEEFSKFLSELKKCKYNNIIRQITILDNILHTEFKQDITKEDFDKVVKVMSRYANYNIDVLFKKGYNYPFRKDFIKVLSKLIYIYKLDERTLSDLNKHLKETFKKELLNKYSNYKNTKKKKKDFGYEISNDTSTNMLVKINGDLLEEKKILIDKYNKGEKIKFDRPYSNSIQAKKVDIINSYFDERYEFELTHDSTEEEFVKFIMNLCNLADEITDDMFKEVLFAAHDSSNLAQVQSYEKNEALRTLYSLYPSKDRLEKYEKTKRKFEQTFQKLTNTKRDNIYKKVYEEKQKKHIPINELLPSKEAILSDLVIRETKFIDSHAVEEFKHKALNYGKYLNYDLEIVARDIDVNELPGIYQKLKRNITYTNFVEEIKPGEDREKKYKEARIIQRKTLAVAQEMIAKTILNKSYSREYDMSYDSYQAILNNIYKNILHEEKLLNSYDEFNDEEELLERSYNEKKKEWDEKSAFVKALYLVISNKEG